ncbi:hypothetical protein GN244_ATG11568 [Phytophthora infestans]|uniref:Uncharacterized protein n=1 Tax=Phytophthora infestans TaxID=4787 RepID=A0A833SNP0_PHYIN|nr:hypothetical protein GN244_ATG11568 [Phytophthora infestans]KAF4129494.1 hypothetical protein GN958_ATG21318 [Phytophthora infestans]KAF4138977.1 hypothetical protein GN958_ATG11934 [Phytophthora infestans]
MPGILNKPPVEKAKLERKIDKILTAKVKASSLRFCSFVIEKPVKGLRKLAAELGYERGKGWATVFRCTRGLRVIDHSGKNTVKDEEDSDRDANIESESSSGNGVDTEADADEEQRNGAVSEISDSSSNRRLKHRRVSREDDDQTEAHVAESLKHCSLRSEFKELKSKLMAKFVSLEEKIEVKIVGLEEELTSRKTRVRKYECEEDARLRKSSKDATAQIAKLMHVKARIERDRLFDKFNTLLVSLEASTENYVQSYVDANLRGGVLVLDNSDDYMAESVKTELSTSPDSTVDDLEGLSDPKNLFTVGPKAKLSSKLSSKSKPDLTMDDSDNSTNAFDTLQ